MVDSRVNSQRLFRVGRSPCGIRPPWATGTTIGKNVAQCHEKVCVEWPRSSVVPKASITTHGCCGCIGIAAILPCSESLRSCWCMGPETILLVHGNVCELMGVVNVLSLSERLTSLPFCIIWCWSNVRSIWCEVVWRILFSFSFAFVR